MCVDFANIVAQVLDEAERASARPAWFIQNFSETFLKPVNDEIVVPCGIGAEAFVNAEDIASVAAATLSAPAQHANRAYSPTDLEALTFEEALYTSRTPSAVRFRTATSIVTPGSMP